MFAAGGVGASLALQAPLTRRSPAAGLSGFSHEFAEPRPVDQLEIGSASPHERMVAAKIVAKRNALHALGEIGRSVARVDEIAQDGFERA